MTFVNN